MDPSELVYRRPSSCSGGDCVEVGVSSAVVHVRDTKDRTRTAIVFPASEWAAFVAEVKRGGFYA
jgi:hypothetical protein